MSYYRKKPVVIEAMQWDGSMDSYETIHKRWPSLENSGLTSHPTNRTVQWWAIRTLEGQHVVSVGDYIIKGVKGEFYPCKPDIFAMTYDAAEQAPQPGLCPWQPIETAPKDGTPVLLTHAGGRIAEGSWHKRYAVWSWPYVMVEPTQWMPRPPVAVIAAEQAPQPADQTRADFSQRCTLATNCLPVAEYRAWLERLHTDMLAEIACLQNVVGELAAEHTRLLAGSGEPTKYEFQDPHEGTWYPFLNDAHYRNTVEDGRWPIRALCTAEQMTAAVLRATLAAREACAAECDKVLGENAISAAIRGMQ